MKINRIHIILYSLLYFFLSCKPEITEPISIKTVNYTTLIDEDQKFDYYYDDGQKVAGGLDEYMTTIRSTSGTFTKESLLLLSFKNELDNLPKHIIPYTFFVGTNHKDSIYKPVEFWLNLNYPFNNYAHEKYENEVFFQKNISKMKLYKVNNGKNGNLYYDPEITYTTIPFEYMAESNEIKFTTQDLKANYGLCWEEIQFRDSLSFKISDDINSNHTIGIEDKTWSPNLLLLEGARYTDNILSLYYNDIERISLFDLNDLGWKMGNISVNITEPSKGIISHEKIESDIIISIIEKEYTDYSHLNIINETIIEIEKMPTLHETGIIHFKGKMNLQVYQKNVEVDLFIQFTQQR